MSDSTADTTTGDVPAGEPVRPARREISAYMAANNFFRCGGCGTIHGFCQQGDYPDVTPIEHTQRYADCTMWSCPSCGRQHDSRQLHGDLFGFRTTATFEPVDPNLPHRRIIRNGDDWMYETNAFDRGFGYDRELEMMRYRKR